MKKLTDEEMQEMLDGGITPDDAGLTDESRKALEAYRLLFTSLDQVPVVALSPNFSSKISGLLLARKNRYSDLKLFALVTFVLLIFLAATIFYLSADIYLHNSGIFLALSKYKYIFLFGLITLGIIQYADLKIFSRYPYPPAPGTPA